MNFQLNYLIVVLCSLVLAEDVLQPPNRKRFEVTPGRVTEVRLSKPNVVIGMTWTYHIRLSSNQNFVPVMWLGYPVYLKSEEEATSFETCLAEDEKPEHSTHHILNVAYRTEGFFVKMTNFLGNETSEVLLANYPDMIIFSTEDNCYHGEMQVYETVELYARPKSKPCKNCKAKSGAHGGHGHHHQGRNHDHGDGTARRQEVELYDASQPIVGYEPRNTGRGTQSPPTPLDMPDGTTYTPAIVIACMIGVGIIYSIISSIIKKNKAKQKVSDGEKLLA